MENKIEESIEKCLERYIKAYDILMDYFEELSDKSKSEIHEKLNKINL